MLKKLGLDQNQFNNYRPVSNLPFLSKILEKVVLKQVMEHIIKNQNLVKLEASELILSSELKNLSNHSRSDRAEKPFADH